MVEKILAVLGPAVVHTGGVEHVCKLIRSGYLNVLFAGNALAGLWERGARSGRGRLRSQAAGASL